MTTIELSDEELDVVRTALEAYAEELGQDEQGRINAIQRVLGKLGGGSLSKTIQR